jgi:hypothetical protein
MVTGVVPFANSNPLDCWMKKIRNEFPAPKELNSAVSDRVDWAIRRAMSAEPSLRPASCREFVEDLTGHSRTTPTAMRAATPGAADLWYMVYRDETGQTHTVKGATANIRNALKDNLLGDASTILVGRSKTGQFLPIGSVPEFRDLVLTPAPATPTKRSASMGPPASRKISPDEATDIGMTPVAVPGGSSSRVGRGGPLSGRQAPPPARPSYPDTPRPVGLPSPRVSTPTPLPRPEVPADTLDYQTATPTPPPTATPHRSFVPPDAAPAKPGFDWTPVLMVVVAALSAGVGYFFFMK